MNKLKKESGFTLIELMIVLAIAAIAAAVALPSLLAMRESANFREASRNIASTLRDARSRAISQNLEHRILFNVAQSRYQLEQGNQSSNTNWAVPANVTVVYTRTFQNNVTMAATLACDNFADRTIEFNPNGSANTLFICVMDGNTRRFQVGVSSATTGRIEIRP